MKRKIHYYLMDPTGNMTVLVDTPVRTQEQPAVAAALMKLEPPAEQLGFLSPSDDCDISLRMAGGEFCGNAAMGAAAYCSMRTGMSCARFTVRSSGAPDPVSVEIRSGPDATWSGTVDMPLPRSIERFRFSNGRTHPVVSFHGISHVILEQMLPREEAENLVRQWCGELGADALGLLFLDQEAGSLTPLVYVPAADTLFWESACGSGSCAVGAWLALERGSQTTVSLRQPGGTLKVSSSPGGALLLTGTVRCLYGKTALLDLQA